MKANIIISFAESASSSATSFNPFRLDIRNDHNIIHNWINIHISVHIGNKQIVDVVGTAILNCSAEEDLRMWFLFSKQIKFAK